MKGDKLAPELGDPAARHHATAQVNLMAIAHPKTARHVHLLLAMMDVRQPPAALHGQGAP